MVVVAEDDAVLVQRAARRLERLGGGLVAPGVAAAVLGEEGADDGVDLQRLGAGDHLLDVLLQHVDRVMPAARLQPRVVQRLADGLGVAQVPVPGQLDELVADLGHLFHGAGEVLGRKVADGVKLKRVAVHLRHGWTSDDGRVCRTAIRCGRGAIHRLTRRENQGRGASRTAALVALSRVRL